MSVAYIVSFRPIHGGRVSEIFTNLRRVLRYSISGGKRLFGFAADRCRRCLSEAIGAFGQPFAKIGHPCPAPVTLSSRQGLTLTINH
jgi:hypothetical protein